MFSLLAVATVACEDSSSSSSSSSSTGGPVVTVPGNDAGTTPTPVETCKAPTKGPTLHKGDIAADETWAADASPHIIEGNVTVRNARTLTIEPCAEVLVAKDAYLQIAFPGTPNQGALIAEGTANKPIRFAGKDGARWGSIFVEAPGTARLAYVTIDGAGADDFQHGASLTAVGDGVDGADPLVFIDHVTITKSRGTGAWMQRGATFMPNSHDLTIKESGSEQFPYAIEIEEHALDALPSGSYTGNALDEILLDPRGGQTAGSGILADSTIHDHGVPYHVGRSTGTSLIIGGRTDGQLVTLTIEPGVKMKFGAGGALKVQHFTTDKPSTAAIRALGTAAKPIVLTSAAATPKAGDWMGVWFGGIPGDTNTLDHVQIEYAGGDCGCILNTCSNIAEHEGAIIFTAQPPKAFVTNTKFVSIANHAITEGYDGAFVDFRPTNEFTGVAGCKQTRPRVSKTSCPQPLPACDGMD